MNNFLTVLTSNGTFVEVIPLSGGEFTQPEGLAFNSKGEMFISNEGKKNKGNIVKVKIADAK